MSTQEAYSNCRFYVMIDGMTQAVFTELSGLQLEMEVTEYAEGGNNNFVHRLPGRIKVSNVTLKRGMTATNEFFQWYVAAMSGKVKRRNISVVMYDTAGKELLRWNFIRAYPVKWIGPQMSAGGNALAVETLELAHDGLNVG
ncbi:MAG TPA: phage tail protein [Roseiflexaceae bacterium]|nr:phage tail protein [Roseiflexaceae bacterium]